MSSAATAACVHDRHYGCHDAILGWSGSRATSLMTCWISSGFSIASRPPGLVTSTTYYSIYRNVSCVYYTHAGCWILLPTCIWLRLLHLGTASYSSQAVTESPIPSSDANRTAQLHTGFTLRSLRGHGEVGEYSWNASGWREPEGRPENCGLYSEGFSKNNAQQAELEPLLLKPP